MFPIRDHNPSQRTPYITYALIAINVAVFLSYWPFLEGGDLNQFFAEWAMTPHRIINGAQLETIFTSMFLHGGVMHLLGNMLFLWIFGDNLEDRFGHAWFLAFYLASGLLAAAAQILIDPFSISPMVGASGAIAGVMGGYLLLFPKAKVDILIIFIVFFKIFPIPAWIALGIWFGLQLFNGVAQSADGIAYMAHVGGFIGGLAFTIPLWLQLGGRDFWKTTDGRPPNPEAKYKYARSNTPKIRRK